MESTVVLVWVFTLVVWAVVFGIMMILENK